MTKRTQGHPFGIVETYDKLLAGTRTVTVAPVRLVAAPHVGVYKVWLQADPDNTDTIFVGNQNVQPMELAASFMPPGFLPIHDLSEIWVRANSGTQRVNWLAFA